MDGIRIGVLGAARIAPQAIVKPAAKRDDASVAAVAARDRSKAEAFAHQHGIPRVHDSYASLLADPEIDAVYNPLPNGLHGEWTIAALESGKHVLCEKPATSNAAEAREVKAVADAHRDLVLMEAFHYRYHPFAARMQEIVRSGELGTVERVETQMCFPLLKRDDIRWDYALAGGATMDVGCYTIHCLRLLAGEEPEVVSAEAKLRSANVDRATVAEMRFPSGGTGRIHCSMWSSSILKLGARVVGSDGEMKVRNFTMPHLFGKLTVSTTAGSRSEAGSKDRTYDCQLDAFCRAVGGDASANLTPPSDSVATMEVIDAVYEMAGLPLRGTG
jgi:predicted dehydrogenase